MKNPIRQWAGLLVLLALRAGAGDWPGWRGPQRDGIWRETGVLESAPAGGFPVRWRTPIGPGWSSPVVVGRRVCVTDMRLDRPRAWERVQCFETSKGRRLWSRERPLSYPDWAFIPEHGGGPASTPVIERGRLYLLGRNGLAECLDVQTGRTVWEHALGTDYTIPELSCRASPLIEGDLLIVIAGGRPGACVVALDKRDGRQVWKALDDIASNSSPLIAPVGRSRQLIVWTDNAVTGLDPSSGGVVWRKPMNTSNNDAVATPVAAAGRVLVSGLMLGWRGAEPEPQVLWPESLALSRRILSNTSTAVIDGGYVYGPRSSGEYVCLDARDGRQVWATTNVTGLKFGASVQAISHGPVTFLLSDEGNLILTRLAPDAYHETGRAEVLRPTSVLGKGLFAWVPPACAQRSLFLRNDQELVCLSLAAPR